jgi:hypothetical protein
MNREKTFTTRRGALEIAIEKPIRMSVIIYQWINVVVNLIQLKLNENFLQYFHNAN